MAGSNSPLRLLVLGAHPDDAEFHAGGLMAIYRNGGHRVKAISLTNGDAGHHKISGQELARIRKKEGTAAAAVIGSDFDAWDNHDGQLQPTLELRFDVIREIRTFKPDLVLTHRVCDYHPDHRAVGQVVQDASYMVRVPPVVPDVPALAEDPVVAYMGDQFTRPTRLQADVILEVTDQIETIVDMLHCHESQVYQWLPHVMGAKPGTVPADSAERKVWLKGIVQQRLCWFANQYRKELITMYGKERGNGIQHVEVFEISEYARKLDEEERRRLFSFVPEITVPVNRNTSLEDRET